jgi:hypothetical protein
MTRHRHHAISTIVDGMLITPARRETACRPLSHATGLILAGSISESDSGIAIVAAHRQAICRREEPEGE